MQNPRRVLVIFNPVAGPRRRRRLDRVLRALDGFGCVVSVRETRALGDAEVIARAADAETFDLVAVAGGDGTLNEAINGLADNPLPLAVIPLGTANVLANELGLRRRAAPIARAIATAPPRPIHLGQANGRRFAMMVGVGIDARIVEALAPGLKRWIGKCAYVAGGVTAIARYRPCRYLVETDGIPHTAAAAIVANGHYYGGRFVLARAARLADPWLHVVLLERPGRWNLLRYGLAIALRRLDRLPDVRIIAARAIIIRGPEGEAAQADGDLAARLPLTIGVAERPLAVIGGRG